MSAWRVVILVVGLACGGGDGAEPEATPKPVELAGQYHVTGVTIDETSGVQRPIQGHVNLVITDSTYTTHFELDSVYPGTDSVAAEIVGTGEGSVDGMILLGTAQLQIVASTVPGLDVGFAYIPHGVSPRVSSTSRAEFFEDGSVRVEIENAPSAEGSDYQPTKTVLVGYRLGPG